jgi:hypothetical protein
MDLFCRLTELGLRTEIGCSLIAHGEHNRHVGVSMFESLIDTYRFNFSGKATGFGFIHYENVNQLKRII